MEIKVYQDTVTAGQVICDTKQELSVEAEILIPDYLPQVFKIVKCFVSCVVLQNSFLRGASLWRGICAVWCCTSRKRRPACAVLNTSCPSQSR